MFRWIERHQKWLVWLWFAVLALFFTRPLITRASHQIAGEIGDNIYFIWMIGWVEKALFRLGVDPLDVWFLNYPEGWNMAHTEISPSQLILGQPFSLLGGETFAYNMVMLLSFILSGVIMYGWAKHLSGSSAAGLLSGTIYACLPYWQAHFLIGHLNLSGTQWMPLFFWGWFDLLKPGTQEFRKKPAIMAAVGLGLVALTSQYYFFMTVIIAAFQTLFVLLFSEREKFRSPAFWKSCGFFLLVSMPMLLAAELPFLTLAGSGGMPDRDWGAARMYSAGLTDYLLPGTTHFLFGNWAGSHFDRSIWNEATLYIGIVSLVLCLFGLCRKDQDPWLKKILLSGMIAAVVLSMGTDLHWNNAPVEWTLPSLLSEGLGRETLPIFLPGFFLFKFFPFYAKLRAMMRFGVFALLFCACGAGFGLIQLMQRFPQKKTLLTLLALALVIFDFFPKAFPVFSEVGPREADLWLAEQEGSGSVMRYPFSLNDDQAGTYYTLYNEKPFIGGFFNAFPTDQYQRVRGELNRFPSVESLSLAHELGVGFVLLEKDEFIRQADSGEIPWANLSDWEQAAEGLDLSVCADFDSISIYCLGDK